MVLIESLSFVLRRAVIDRKYPGGWAGFEKDVPNPTRCTDGELVRVGFMSPMDVEAFGRLLSGKGLRYQVDGKADDFAIVDQHRGVKTPCDWIQIRRIKFGSGGLILAALAGSKLDTLAAPSGWQFEGSLSQSSSYVPPEQIDKALEILRHENGRDIYKSKLTGEEVFVGRSASPAEAVSEPGVGEWAQIEAVASRALELADEGERARSSRDLAAGERVYAELMEKLLPETERLTSQSVRYGGFAHFAAGLVLRVLHIYEPAIEQFKRSLELQPDVDNTLQEITGCLGQLGRYAEARPYAERAVAVAPDSPAAWGNLAMCLIQLKEKSAARKAIDRAISLDPADAKNQYIATNFDRYFR